MKLSNPANPSLDLATLRARLAASPPKAVWRCLEDLAAEVGLPEGVRQELHRQAAAWSPALDRRAFLTLLGASLTLAGLNGCTVKQPDEAIVPYVQPPEGRTPGKPQFYATALCPDGYATGVLVTSREGRSIKIEGNPGHPASLGATDALLQAELLALYDPDRSQSVVHRGLPDTWEAFLSALNAQMQSERTRKGAGLRILTETVTSPTLSAQMQTLLAQFPQAKWIVHEAISRDSVRQGAQVAFGADTNTLYHFDRADVIVTLDGDFLLTMPGHVRYARDFATQRRVRQSSPRMNRLYTAECTPTLTGAMADHRLPLRPSELENIVHALAQAMGLTTAPAAPPSAEAALWVALAASDLRANRGRSLIVAGPFQPPNIHALAHALNAHLGNVGQTLTYTEPVEMSPGAQTETLAELLREMQSGQTQTLLILGGNPVYTTPADLDFASALAQVPCSMYLALYEDETSALCQWHVPAQHTLKAWGDARAYDGTTTIQQPLIAPLYESTHSAQELLDALLMPPGCSGHDIVKTY